MLYEPVNKRNLVNVEEQINRYFTSLGVYYGDDAYDFTIHTHLLDNGFPPRRAIFAINMKMSVIIKIYNL